MSDFSASFSKHYIEALLAGTGKARDDLPEMARAGDAVAERLVSGGRLFIASVRPDFVSEGTSRAGGLMLLNDYAPSVELSPADVVIVGWSNTTHDQDLVLLQRLQEAFVVGVGPTSHGGVARQLSTYTDLFFESSLLLPSAVTARFSGESYPLVSLQNLVILWTFTAELVAAFTRQSYMAAMYQSVCVPGGYERNDKLRDHHFQEHHEVPPIPPGQLGRTYLEKIDDCFRALLEEEIAAIEEVAQVCAKVRRDGHNIHAFLIGHFPAYQLGAPGDPEFMQRIESVAAETPSITQLEENVRPGDLFFYLGYYRRPAEAYETVRRAQGLIVEVITGTDSSETGGPQPDYIIHPKWPYGDSIVPVRNYDVKILPSSGIVQTAIYWAVLGSILTQTSCSGP